MFINFWYPAEESEQVTRDPLKVQMLGLQFVLWRDENGTAHCISNTCTHRGGSLGDGKVVGNCVQCPYHGWQFNGEGLCERIPSLGPLDQVPERAQIDAYPVEERYGLVFVFLGDLPESERPTIMPLPEYGQDGWRALHTRYTWNCNYVRLVENQTDPSHVEYVHSGMGMGGRDQNYRVPKINIEEYPWGAGAMVQFYSPELPDQDMKDMSPEGRGEAGSGYHGICSTWTHVHFNETDRFYPVLYTVPRDELTLEIFQIAMRNCMLDDKFDKNFRERIGVAIEEDRIVVEKLDPPIPSEQEIGEFIVPADDVLMHYRRARKEWQERGWRMDLKTMRDNQNRIAYAIPSPARRERPDDWALTPVPLL
ncbi:MAG: aromatic ring-hydroxylating dioxygenase subunit alpha [Gammaproteobacteria bacterium]|nr:aromatic ring-hydroxylating dioxygenase subunit alpha [Gammaproteobacteria bacterium]